MKKNFQILSLLTLLFSISLQSQNVGINATGAAPDGGAMLDISSTNKGLLIPRVNITNLATVAPITGSSTVSMLVYNTNATTGAGYYYWDGANWLRFTTGSPLVDNGLYFNGGANRVRLGGPLVENTIVTQANFGMTWNLSGTGDFIVQDNGTTRFSVQDNGRTTVGSVNNAGQFNVTGDSYFSDDIYLRDGAVNGGDILVRIYDSGDDGIIDVYENNAMNHRIHANSVSIFNDQQTTTADFRIETSGQNSMFFIDAGTNEIGIRTNAPTNMLHMTNGGQAVGANSMANFENAGGDGVALSGANISTANAYNAIEGVTYGTYSSVAGISITTGAGGDGVYGTTNDYQSIGVLGSRFNSGGANSGWGGLFLDDLGYTGGVFNASDRRLKKDINPLIGSLSIINQLEPVSYYYDIEKYPEMGLKQHKDYGFIAQDLKEIIPEIVAEKLIPINGTAKAELGKSKSENDGLFYMIDYTRLIPITIQAIKEQQQIIENQNTKIAALEKIVLELQQKMNK